MPETMMKPRLADLCAECFMLILHLRANRELGDPEVLRQRIKELLNQLERKVHGANIEVAKLQQARYALVALIDETIFSSQWSKRTAWMSKPLHVEFYGAGNAGDEFFMRLHELRQRAQVHAEIIEVFYLCLVLGFKGRYFREPERLRLLIEDTYTEWRRVSGNHTKVEALSPNAKRHEGITATVAKQVPLWVVGAGAAAAGIVVFLIFKFLLIDPVAQDVIKLLH